MQFSAFESLKKLVLITFMKHKIKCESVRSSSQMLLVVERLFELK